PRAGFGIDRDATSHRPFARLRSVLYASGTDPCTDERYYSHDSHAAPRLTIVLSPGERLRDPQLFRLRHAAAGRLFAVAQRGIDEDPIGVGHRYLDDGATQAKFAASFTSPEPRYCATCGYGHSGRVSGLDGSSVARPVPTSRSGATPCSTQRSSAVKMSCSGSRLAAPPPPLPKLFGPAPPPQCPIPGTRNSR